MFSVLYAGSKSSGSIRTVGERRSSMGKEKEQKTESKKVGVEGEPDRTTGNIMHCERPASQLSHHSHCSHGLPGVLPIYQPPVQKACGPPGAPPVRDLAAVPPELIGSRQSFQKAMGNPCEFFVDIMWQYWLLTLNNTEFFAHTTVWDSPLIFQEPQASNSNRDSISHLSLLIRTLNWLVLVNIGAKHYIVLVYSTFWCRHQLFCTF